MPSTLLGLIQTVCNELGLNAPTSVVGNVDAQIIQLLALANREGKEFALAPTPFTFWQALRGEYIFNWQNTIESYALPSDYEYFAPSTAWNRTTRWQLLGPLTPQEWQILKSGLSPTGPRTRYRIINNRIYFDPIPSSTDQIVFEYCKNTWCQSSAAVAQAAWANDLDTYLLDEDCFILGLKMRFLQAKGLSYDQERQDYREAKERVISRDSVARPVVLNANSSGLRLLSSYNIPDTGYGT